MKALLVDDDPVTQRIVRALLAPQGWTLDVAPDAARARERVRAERYDLLLVDFVLPDVDGVTLVRELRGHAPVLALTGADSETVVEELLRAGAHDVLEKSRLDADALRRALAAARAPAMVPLRIQAPQAPAEGDAEPMVMPAPGRALVVDDVASARKLTRALLERDGWRVDEAETALQGIEMAVRRPYDVVVLDYLLPDVDGVGLLHEMRANGVQSPVVVLSAHGDERVAMDFVMEGAGAMVPKAGLTRARLQEALAEALAMRPSASVNRPGRRRARDER